MCVFFILIEHTFVDFQSPKQHTQVMKTKEKGQVKQHFERSENYTCSWVSGVDKESPNFSVKGQTVAILDLANHKVFVAASQRRRSGSSPRQNINEWEC